MQLKNQNECKRYMAVKKTAYILSELKKREHLEEYESKKMLLEGSLVDDERRIFLNTLEFPYDIELCNDLFSINLSDYDSYTSIQQKFNLTDEILADKCNEYISYSFSNLVNSGIDPDFSKYVSSFVFERDSVKEPEAKK